MAVFRPRAGGAFDHSTCTAFELHNHNGRILNLDPGLPKTAGNRPHRTDRTREINQRIDRVDALIHEHTAAIEPPGAPPRRGVVIRLIAKPFHVAGGGGERAEAALIRCLFEEFHSRGESAV